ncbi:MAG: Ig-like domain-containing protein [Actinomycetota bacterium]
MTEASLTFLGRFRKRTLLALVTGVALAVVPLRAHPANAAEIQVTTTHLGTASSKSQGATLDVPVAPLSAGNTVIVSFALGLNTAGDVTASDNSSQAGAANVYRVDADVTHATSGVRTVLLSSVLTRPYTNSTKITISHPDILNNNEIGRAATATVVSGMVAASATENRDQSATGSGTTLGPGSVSTASTAQTAHNAELVFGAFGIGGLVTAPPAFTKGVSFTALSSETSPNVSVSEVSINPEFKVVNSRASYAADGSLAGVTPWAGAVATYERVNVAPSASAGTASGNEDTDISANLAATDADGANSLTPDALTYSIQTGPANGTLGSTSGSMTKAGTSYTASVTYTPDADFYGSDSFTYEVDDGNGGVSSATVSITVDPVNDAPSVSLSGEDSVDEGDTETYSYVVTDPDGPAPSITESCGLSATKIDTVAANSFDCVFSDGPSSSTVSVIADDGSALGSDSKLVTVADVVPSVTLSGDTEVNEGTTKSYTYVFTDPAAETGAATESCGAGATYTDTAAADSFDCTFPDGPASPVVNVTVTDDDANTAEDPTTVTVANVAPTVELTGATSADEGDTKTYTYSITDDGTDTFPVPDRVPDCDDGVLSNHTTTASGGSFDCTFADGPATPVVEVKVSDEDGESNTDTVTVTVADVVPSVALSGDTTANEGATKTYTYTVTDPAAETGAASESCGAGATYTDTAAADSFDCSFPDGPASPVVNVSVSDDDSNTADDPTTVTVANVAPSATFTVPNSAREDSNFSISLLSASDPAGANDTLEFAFDCGPGYGSFGTEASETCDAVDGPATQTVQGKVQDEDGGVSEYTASVTIKRDSGSRDTTAPEMEAFEVSYYRFSPNGDGQMDSFDVNAVFSEETKWTLSIAGGSEETQLLGTSQDSDVFGAAGAGQTMSVQWNGTAGDGIVVQDGTYLWTLTARDAAGNEMAPRTGTIVVDRTAPVFLRSKVRPNPFDPSTQNHPARIRFSVNEASTVTVKIRCNGKTVKRFGPVALESSGSLRFVWNGRNERNRLVHEGRYRVVIKAVDLAANRTVNRALRIQIVR